MQPSHNPKLKQLPKLNAFERGQPTTVSELQQLNRHLEQIKSVMMNYTSQHQSPMQKAVEKLVDQMDKQKRVMQKLRNFMEKGLTQLPVLEADISHPVTAVKDSGVKINRSDHEELHTLTPVKVESQVHQMNSQSHIAESRYEEGSGKIITGQSLRFNTGPKVTSGPQLMKRLTNIEGPWEGEPTQGLERLKILLERNPDNIKPLQEWVGGLFRSAAMQAFQGYSKGLDEEDMKIKFAEHVLKQFREYVLMVRGLKTDMNTMEKLQAQFEKIGKKAVEFLLFKYPQSRKKVADATVSRLIKAKQMIMHPMFDILRNGHIELNLYNLNIGLNKQIKLLINELIKETNRFYDKFKTEMMTIFMEEQAKDASFSFLIGRKIKQTTQEYTDQELSAPGFFIKGSEILRILIKWIEQLVGWFTNPRRTLENQFGFKMEEVDVKLGVDDREEMWGYFQSKYEELLGDFEKTELFMRRNLSSIIVLSQQEIISKYGSQPVGYLSRDDILVPLICKYVSDTLECYAIETIRALLSRISEILETYGSNGSEQSSFDLYSFTVNDLLRCKCTGKKDQILRVYSKLLTKEQAKQLTIVAVKNRLALPTSDILVTYKLPGCFLLCEIQLALSTAHEQVNDHFNHFLYEQHRSRHGIVCQLAMLVSTLDPKRKFFATNKMSFAVQQPCFSAKGDKVICNQNPQQQLQFSASDIPYICRQCCRFVDAYRYYMLPRQCKLCAKKVCPACYLKILPQQVAIKEMLQPVPMLRGYFQPVSGPLIEIKLKKLQDMIMEHLDTSDPNLPKFLAVFYYKNNLDDWNVNILKVHLEEEEVQPEEEEDEDQQGEGEQEEKKDKKEKQKDVKQPPPPKTYKKTLLETFSNKTFNINELDGSIILLLQPSSPVQFITGAELVKKIQAFKNDQGGEVPFDNMYGLQEDFEIEDQETEQDDVYAIVNPKAKRKMIVDYKLSAEDVEERISDYQLIEIVEKENKAKSGRLVINGLSLNFSLLDKVADPTAIKSIELANCYESSEGSDLKYLNTFPGLDCLYLSGLEEYKEHVDFVFNKNLVELGISKLDLLNFKNIPTQSQALKVLVLTGNCIKQPLPQLNLPNLTTLQLQDNEISSIQNLGTSVLSNLDKLNISNNNVTGKIPQLKLPKLRVLMLKGNYLQDCKALDDSELPLLKVLFLDKNKLKGQFPNLGRFPKLLTCHLSQNDFEVLPVLQSQSLQYLDLSNNRFAGTLPKLTLPNLLTLKLMCNQLNNISTLSECKLHMLQTLYLYNNPFKKFPSICFDNLNEMIIEPTKMRFKINPNDEIDEDYIGLICANCEGKIEKCTANFYPSQNQILCEECEKHFEKKEKIQVCLVKGEDLQRYS